MRRRQPGYSDRTIYSSDRPELRGLGHQTLKRQRGLKGATLGPAGDGKKLSPAEVRRIEEQMRKDGKL